MAEVNLLDHYPRATRNLTHRAAVAEANRQIAKQFGHEFFDGHRDQGYGGYRYDGRWVSVVTRMRDHYALAPDASILDVGCGKGFTLHDFKTLLPQSTVAGIDISSYAIANAMDDMRPFVQVGDCRALPFPDHAFDLVFSVNTVHNVPYDACVRAVAEIERVARNRKFIVVDAYRNEEEHRRLLQWNLTAETILHVDAWVELFAKAGYTGDYYWFTP